MAIKTGIIGAGGMVAYHVEGFKAAGAEIVAIADLNETAARAVAEANGIARTFGSVEAMLETMPELEAVSIIVPNKFHASLAIQALEAGKHVFCEKPPALNAGEVERMIAAANASGKRLMFNFNNRARPDTMAVRGYIDNGLVGRINSAQAKWIRRTGIPGFGGWFTNKAMSGGGPLIDLLHMIDLALYYMGYPEPEHVLAQTFSDFIGDKAFKGPWGIPDVEGGVCDVESACHGFVRFTTGQVLNFQISWAEMVKREEVSVTFQGQGAGGMVQRLFAVDGVDETSTDTAELYVQENGHSVNREIISEEDPSMGRIRSATNFILSLEGREEPLNDMSEALKLMRIIDAAYASAESGKPVTLK
jgi:predicted dehydrogenase